MSPPPLFEGRLKITHTSLVIHCPFLTPLKTGKIGIIFLSLNFINLDSHGFWIGGTDAINEGEWTWVTSGSNFTYSNWAPGFPDDYRGNEDCAELHRDSHFLWNDEKCDHRMSFICELA